MDDRGMQHATRPPWHGKSSHLAMDDVPADHIAAEQFIIYVETMSKTITLDIAEKIALETDIGSEFWNAPNIYVLHLKIAILQQEGILVCVQQIFYNNEALRDTSTLKDCNIEHNSMVQLLMKPSPRIH